MVVCPPPLPPHAPSLSQGVLLDVGANVGLFSLWAAAQRPNLRVVAIEPAAPTHALLKRNLDAAGLLSTGRAVALRLA